MERLREQTLFKTSDEQVLSLARQVARISEFKAGDYVCFQGDTNSPLVMLLAGHLRVTALSEDGHEIPIGTASAGEMVGAVSAINDMPLPGNIVATRDSSVALISRSDARRIFREPGVASALNGCLAQLVRDLAKRQTDQGVLGATARVSAWIVSTLIGAASSEQQTIELPSHASLGAMANVSRETVSRVLASLTRRGVLAKRGRHQISILDYAALRAIAKGSAIASRSVI
ncbi:Crp/Fnr family transcriptional regulator [Paraburkholderia sp. JPY419]|uniref:Crp/Fnr family transcriptional regulator n=1 Tax=Paraburkholderia sp. JPY419 TaxID=667660 RepID=UPI003D25ECA3